MGPKRRVRLGHLREAVVNLKELDQHWSASVVREAADELEELRRVVADYERLGHGQQPPTNGTGTSNAAADSLTAPALAGKRRMILWMLNASPKDAETLGVATGIPGNTLRPRLLECRRAGWVEDSGERQRTLSGREAVVWRITDAGRHALESAQ